MEPFERSLVKEADYEIEKYNNYVGTLTPEEYKEDRKNSNNQKIEEFLFREVRKYPLIKDEEIFNSLYKMYKKIKSYLESNKKNSGELRRHMEDIRNALLIPNLRYIIMKARKTHYHQTGSGKHFLELSDLIDEGSIGLITAFDRFNPNLGIPFIAYASILIRQKIGEAIRDKSNLINISAKKQYEIKTMIQLEELLKGGSERKVSDRELSNFMNIPIQEIKEIRNYSNHKILSLDKKIPGYEELSLSEFIGDKRYNFEERGVNHLLIENIFKVLKDREKNILYLKIKGETLESIGQKYNLTKERVRQIEKRALEKAKLHLKVLNRSIKKKG